MPLSDIVQVTITATSPGVTRAGFGTPLILSANAAWSERVRFYTAIEGVAADFATTTPEYIAANTIFSQSPKPARIAIGRLANKPIPAWDLTPTAINLQDYVVRVGALKATYTADGSATVAEITAGLKLAIDALSVSGLTTTDGTTKLTLSAAAGKWFDVECLRPDVLAMANVAADPGIATDLGNIKLEDDTWYGLLNPWNSAAIVAAAAAWCETAGKLYIAASQDSEIANHALSGATDVAAALKTSAYKRSSVGYHPGNGFFFDAAWAGRVLPTDPGSETWAHKSLVSVPPVKLTATQRTNILAKNANDYRALSGVNITEFGTVADGEFIDVIRFIDWLTARIQENVFNALTANDKVPFTDRGYAVIAAVVEAVLQEGVEVGGLDSYTLSVPKASAADPADKAARAMKGITFSGVLAGAAHTVGIKGTVTA